MKTLHTLLIATLLAVLAIASCDDHEVEELKLDEALVKDVVLTSNIGSKMFSDVLKVRNKSLNMQNNECFSVKHEMSDDKKNMVLHLHYNNCLDGDIVQNGDVKIVIKNALTKDMTMELEFGNFSVNKNEISGKMSLSMKNQKMETVADLKMKYADGSSTSWKGKQTIKLLADGGLEVNGESSGKVRSGKAFTAKEVALIKKADCSWYMGGDLEILFEGNEDYKIHFTSECGNVSYTHKGIKAKLSLD